MSSNQNYVSKWVFGFRMNQGKMVK